MNTVELRTVHTVEYCTFFYTMYYAVVGLVYIGNSVLDILEMKLETADFKFL